MLLKTFALFRPLRLRFQRRVNDDGVDGMFVKLTNYIASYQNSIIFITLSYGVNDPSQHVAAYLC